MVRRNASISSIAVLLAAGAFSTASLLSVSSYAQAQNPFDAMRRTIEGLQQRPAQQAPQTQPAPPPPQTQPRPTASTQPAPMLPEQAAFGRLPPGQMFALQEKLRELGFYTGTVDGAYGPGTSQAVSAWQRNRGFPQTGWLTEPQRGLLLKSKEVNPNGFRWIGENVPSNVDVSVQAEIRNEKQDILSIECRSSGKFSSKPSLSMGIFHNNFPIAEAHTYVFRIGNETHEFKLSQSLFTAETPSDKDALRALIEALIKTDATSFSSQFDNVTMPFSTAGARDALIANENSYLKTGKTLGDCEDAAFKSSNAQYPNTTQSSNVAGTSPAPAPPPASAATSPKLTWSGLYGGWINTQFTCDKKSAEGMAQALIISASSIKHLSPAGDDVTCIISKIETTSPNAFRVFFSCPASEEAIANTPSLAANPKKLYPSVNNFSLKDDVLQVQFLERSRNGQYRVEADIGKYRRCEFIK